MRTSTISGTGASYGPTKARLQAYGHAELTKAGMAYTEGGGTVYAQRISVNKVNNMAGEIARDFPLSADERFGEWIANIIRREHESYRRARPSNMTAPARAA